jgi:hypothetical protein
LFIVCLGAGFEACSSKVFSLTGAGWFLVVVVVLVFKTYGFSFSWLTASAMFM